ncbi:hypothetical protein K1719_041884 [Acacia pycnantha]|nr:hypothetical protein K1719_041884 [Acacia pycnantha]
MYLTCFECVFPSYSHKREKQSRLCFGEHSTTEKLAQVKSMKWISHGTLKKQGFTEIYDMILKAAHFNT